MLMVGGSVWFGVKDGGGIKMIIASSQNYGKD
jgi:hypothetical protein